jgi:hypothetical protein
MKKKIFLLYSILLIISIHDLNGQNNGSTNGSDQTDCIQCLTGELFAPVSAVDPVTWFNLEWLPGDIYLANGEIVRNKLIRYNGSLDELFWKEPISGNTIKLDKEPIVQFHYHNVNKDTIVYFRKIRVKRNALSDSSEVFGQVIYDKGNSLYILHTFNIKGTEIIRTNGTTFEKINYEKIPVYVFMFTKQKTFVTRSLSRRSLFSFCPEKKDRINEFLKENKLGLSVNNFYLREVAQFLGTIIN